MPSRLSNSLLTLAAVGYAAAAFAVNHAALDLFTSFAKANTGAYLWWQEEYMAVFSPANHVGRGANRLMIFGPSEAREAFVTEVFDERLPGLRAYQSSHSIGTVSDTVVLLDYIEQAYGADAVPEVFVLGITTRFIANKLFWTKDSPFRWALDRYSPYFKLDRSRTPPRLVPKPTGESLAARFRAVCHQQRRYKSAFRALARAVLTRVRPDIAEDRSLWYKITPSKFHHLEPRPLEGTKRWLARPTNPFRTLYTWDAAEHRDEVRRDLGLLIDFAERHGMELYIVNLPELPYHTAMYRPGIYGRYLDEVRAAIGNTPFLDLRDLLSDDEFFDVCHPTYEAAVKISARVADFIREHRSGAAPRGSRRRSRLRRAVTAERGCRS